MKLHGFELIHRHADDPIIQLSGSNPVKNLPIEFSRYYPVSVVSVLSANALIEGDSG